MIIQVPLPPVGCSPNAKDRHWRSVGKAKAIYRRWGYLAALEVMPQNWDPSPVVIHHTWYMGGRGQRDESYRPRDIANAISALKACVDGFVDARLIEDDNHLLVSWGKCIFHRKKKDHGGRACVILELELESLK